MTTVNFTRKIDIGITLEINVEFPLYGENISYSSGKKSLISLSVLESQISEMKRTDICDTQEKRKNVSIEITTLFCKPARTLRQFTRAQKETKLCKIEFLNMLHGNIKNVWCFQRAPNFNIVS